MVPKNRINSRNKFQEKFLPLAIAYPGTGPIPFSVALKWTFSMKHVVISKSALSVMMTTKYLDSSGVDDDDSGSDSRTT